MKLVFKAHQKTIQAVFLTCVSIQQPQIFQLPQSYPILPIRTFCWEACPFHIYRRVTYFHCMVILVLILHESVALFHYCVETYDVLLIIFEYFHISPFYFPAVVSGTLFISISISILRPRFILNQALCICLLLPIYVANNILMHLLMTSLFPLFVQSAPAPPKRLGIIPQR